MSTKKAAPLLAQQEPRGRNSEAIGVSIPIVQNLPHDVKAIRDLQTVGTFPFRFWFENLIFHALQKEAEQ